LLPYGQTAKCLEVDVGIFQCPHGGDVFIVPVYAIGEVGSREPSYVFTVHELPYFGDEENEALVRKPRREEALRQRGVVLIG